MQSNTVLQPDDVFLIRLFCQDFLFLTAHQIHRLFPHRSPHALTMRLQKLVQANFLNQRHVDNESLIAASRQPLYYLGQAGKNLIDPDATNPHIQSRIKRARDYATTALPHLIFENSIHVAFLAAHRRYPHYRLLSYIPQHDRLWTDLIHHHFPFHPDGYAEYRKGAHTFHCFIEADRATYRSPHLADKLATYASYAASGNFPIHFGASAPFRVLLITTTPTRSRQLLKATTRHDHSLFWIGSQKSFYAEPLFHPYWFSPLSNAPHALDEPLEATPDPSSPPPTLSPSSSSAASPLVQPYR